MNDCIYWIEGVEIFEFSHCEIDKKFCPQEGARNFDFCPKYLKEEKRMSDLADEK